MIPGPHSERALILLPQGDEGARVAALLAQAGHSAQICADLSALQRQVEAGAGLAIIADEVVRDLDLGRFAAWVAEQPAWSDLPFVVVSERDGSSDTDGSATRYSDVFGNVAFVERPLQPAILVATVRTAVRGRRHQYEARAHIEVLHEREEQFRIAQQAGGIGTFVWDPAAGSVTMSENFRRLWGVTAETMPLSQLGAMIHEEDRVFVRSLHRGSQENALAYTEYRIWRPDTGESRWLARRGEVQRDAAGQITRGFGVIYDITERKRAEAELRRSEEQFRVFAQAMPNQVWAGAPDGSLDWFNEQVYAYSGAQPGELDGSGWTGMVHPDDLASAGEKWAASLADGSVYEAEFRLRDRHGAYRWYLARAVPLRDADGAILRWIGTNTDVHDRRLASVELERLNSLLRQEVSTRTADRDRLWRLSQEVMLVCDFDGVIKSVNPSFERVLGWSDTDAIGHRLGEFIHPDDLEPTVSEVGKLGSGAPTLAFENRYRCKDGSYRVLSWTAVPFENHIHAIARDVTSEREAADALALAEDQLRQSQKMEAVGQLTGGIAHDFNNLLTGIVGSLDLMQTRMKQGRTDGLDRYAKAAMASANRAAALTHRLLAFARRQPLDPRQVDANALITGMEDLLRRTMGERIHLEIVTAGGLWPTLCDPNQLENAILNLAINGRDAMPDGGKLTIETCNTHLDRIYAAQHPEVDAGQYICICVTDTGAGMTPEVIARAFDPFFTTKPIGQGTGLGLSMIYGFARQSDGHAKIYSEIGHGTTVKIYLPRFRGAAAEIVALPDPETVPRAESGETVLVVEDEPIVRDLIVEVLHDLGYRALEAADGPAGLAILLSDETIDLLVSDVGLPGLNGRQLADRAREKRPDLKVLFITGYAENAIFGNGQLETGMQMITKPFPVDALAARIRGMIEGT